jgi:hypothetical protein
VLHHDLLHALSDIAHVFILVSGFVTPPCALSGAAAAGVAGLAAGALIGGAIANSAQAAPPPPATVDGRLAAWCARRYRTFDPVTGTFMAPSGERLVCTYP